VVAEVQRQVDALTLRAPFDGQVGQVQAVHHQPGANAPVLGVVDLSVRSRDQGARELRPRPGIGMPAELTSGNGKPFRARSARCRRKWSTARSTPACASPRAPEGLRQSQRLSRVLDTRKNVLVERGPSSSKRRPLRLRDGRPHRHRRPVQLGVSSLGEVEVRSGLQPGDRVVVSGSDLFGDAQRDDQPERHAGPARLPCPSSPSHRPARRAPCRIPAPHGSGGMASAPRSGAA
jgi:HlyD family secretion protein